MESPAIICSDGKFISKPEAAKHAGLSFLGNLLLRCRFYYWCHGDWAITGGSIKTIMDPCRYDF